jgi:initiation factor 1A
MPPKKKKINNSRNKRTFDITYADRDIGQEYGYIEKLFGNCHFKVISIENEERVASLSGIMKKRCRVREHDLVLMEPMGDGESVKYQIIFRYTQDQKKILEKEGRLKKVETEKPEVEDSMFMFEGEQDKLKDETKEVDEWFIDEI